MAGRAGDLANQQKAELQGKAYLDELAARTERLREAYETRITTLAELKQSILQKAFAGELTSPPSQATKEVAE